MNPTTATESKPFCFSVAVELNNLAVDLINMKDYTAALYSVKEAIQVMKSVIKPAASQQAPDSDDNSEATNDYTSPSNVMRYARSQLSIARTKGLEDIDEDHDGLTTIDHRRARRSSQISNYMFVSDCSCPLRIEEHLRDSEMASAVLLYNFGVLHYVMSKEQHNVNTAREANLKTSALRLFKMAYSVLSQKSMLIQMNPEDMSQVRLLLLIVVLNALVQVQEEMGGHREVTVWLSHLVRLGSVALEQQHGATLMTTLAPAA